MRRVPPRTTRSGTLFPYTARGRSRDAARLERARRRAVAAFIRKTAMATLVLTVVGGIVGGPVGAAIGAAVGQQFDAQIFKPKGREGQRLADLKNQASTYGQPLRRLFGTMRVAGSVRRAGLNGSRRGK